MADMIVLLAVVVLLVFAVKGTLKHFKGEGPCCGGGGGTLPPLEKKLDGPVICKKTLIVEGMHCAHCVNAVTDAINQVEGAAAKVYLKGGKAVVSCDREVPEDTLVQAVTAAGYRVKEVR